MKMKYKYIEFIQLMSNIPVFFCKSRRNAELGTVSFCVEWKCFEFIPDENTGFSSECCRDIAHFLEQLDQEYLKGQKHGEEKEKA